MTLELQCREDAMYTSNLKGIGTGKDRKGGVVAQFSLCENHNQLFQMVDRELVEEAWATCFVGEKATRI